MTPHLQPPAKDVFTWKENQARWKSRWCSIGVRLQRQRQTTAEGIQGSTQRRRVGKVRGGKLVSESEGWVTASLKQNPSSRLVGGSLLISASGAMQLQSNSVKHVGPRCLCAEAAGDWWVSLRHMNHDSRRWKSPLCFPAKPGNRSRRCERWGSLKSWYINVFWLHGLLHSSMAHTNWLRKTDWARQSGRFSTLAGGYGLVLLVHYPCRYQE